MMTVKPIAIRHEIGLNRELLEPESFNEITKSRKFPTNWRYGQYLFDFDRAVFGKRQWK